MNDFDPYPCCEKNKEARAVVFRDYKRKAPKGFYTHCFQSQKSDKWTFANFCPFCGKNLKKLACMI